MRNKRKLRGQAAQRKTATPIQEFAKFRALFVISRFYRSVAFRRTPWGSGRRSGWGAINTNQQPTRKCEINETTADGRCREKTARAAQEFVKNTDSSCKNLNFADPRGPGRRSDGWPSGGGVSLSPERNYPTPIGSVGSPIIC